MKSEKLKGNLDMLLLAVLAAGPGHGYSIITRLRERSAGAFDLPEGTVYPALHRLEAAGLLDSSWDVVARRRRRMYGPTPARPRAFARATAAARRRTGAAGSLIGGVALVAVGTPGVLAWALSALRGGAFVTAPFPPRSYTPADCARWLAGDPAAHSCITAMIADHV